MLTKKERTELHWMVIANERGLGLYSPTIRKYGVSDDYRLDDELCGRGFAERGKRDNGYWITQAGRAALRNNI